ncbi:MAG: 4Fe-4S cluster-binding domain-containing protein, partial [Candidatus Methanoplasma sp.]|nr:4Fe-4S cluster-binding domain-containing protein [Candidatus Methanoplasma sp.]
MLTDAYPEESHMRIMLYTGHEHEEIGSNPLFSAICGIPDILVIGRYRASERNINLTWRGSENQRIVIRGDTDMPPDSNHLELRIDEYGDITHLGYPDEFLPDGTRTVQNTEHNRPLRLPLIPPG